MLHEKALSKKQQRFFGIVRASQKGTLKGEASPQVQRAASSMKKKDVKKFASTKHKGLPEKKVSKEETCGKGEYYCNDEQKCKPIPKGMKVKKDGFLVKELNIREGSLHKWFKGSKSKDGKSGWVNVVTGGTCASDKPGEGTPKCVSSSKRASMSKAERLSAARRKKKADPGQQSKSGAAKPTYVSTDKPKKKMKESFATSRYKEMAKRDAELKRKEDLKVKSKKVDEDFYRKKYDIKDGGYKKTNKMDKSNKRAGDSKAQHRELHKDLAKLKKEENLKEYSPNVSYQAKGGKKSGKLSKSSVYSLRRDDESKKDFRKSHTKDIKDGLMKKESIFTPLVFTVTEDKDKLKKTAKELDKAVEMHKGQAKRLRGMVDKDIKEASDKKGKGSGSKDACYHKVKSRYSVWPSAYASGALVKCRKVGAANWGNSSKKEDYGIISFQDFIYEKCWKGYTKKGMKTMFGKRYPNCVKKEEVDLPVDECWKTHKQVGTKMKGGKMVPDCRPKNEAVEEGVISNLVKKKKEPKEAKPKKAMDAGARGRRLLQRREYKAKVSDFVPKELEDHVVYENPNTNMFPDGTQQKVKKVLDAGSKFMKNNKVGRVLGKIFGPSNPNNKGSNYTPSGKIANSYEPEGQMVEGSAAWQKKAGKNSKGGLNEKGRKSYEAQNPGSDLKAPVTGKVKAGGKAAKRRKSFCARMGGMKGPMKKPNGKPTRKALALRKWKC